MTAHGVIEALALRHGGSPSQAAVSRQPHPGLRLQFPPPQPRAWGRVWLPHHNIHRRLSTYQVIALDPQPLGTSGCPVVADCCHGGAREQGHLPPSAQWGDPGSLLGLPAAGPARAMPISRTACFLLGPSSGTQPAWGPVRGAEARGDQELPLGLLKLPGAWRRVSGSSGLIVGDRVPCLASASPNGHETEAREDFSLLGGTSVPADT